MKTNPRKFSGDTDIPAMLALARAFPADNLHVVDLPYRLCSWAIEPLGVHPDWRQSGLGRAILSEGLRRLYLGGADKVYVETDQQRNAALALYQAAGFGALQDVLVYRRDYGEAQG